MSEQPRPRPATPKPHPFAEVGQCWNCGAPFWISYALLEWTDRYCAACRGCKEATR